MAIAPAMIITSEQTVDRTGRWMKVSTNITGYGLRAVEDGLRAAGFGNWHSVRQSLHTGDDDALAALQSFQHDVVVANQFADLDRPLTRDQAFVALPCYIREILAVHARHGQNGHGVRRLGRPDDTGADEFVGAECVTGKR